MRQIIGISLSPWKLFKPQVDPDAFIWLAALSNEVMWTEFMEEGACVCIGDRRGIYFTSISPYPLGSTEVVPALLSLSSQLVWHQSGIICSPAGK